MEGKEVALAREIYAMELEGAALTAKAKDLKARFDAKCAELQEYLIAEGKKNTGHIEGVGIFSLVRKTHPGVTQAAMPTFLEYLRAEGDGAMIVETVPKATLQKYCKDKIEELTDKLVEDPEYAELLQAELGLGADDVPTPSQLATAAMKRHGVSVFSEVKIGHTKRGK